MRKLVLITSLLVFFLQKADCQFYIQNIDSIAPKSEIHTYAVKWVPSQLIGNFSSYMLAFEHKVSQNMTLQHTIGILTNDQGAVQEGFFDNKRGTKLSTQLRIYFPDISKTNLIFLGFEPFSNNFKYDRTRVFEVSCGLGSCSYFQEANYKLNEKQRGGRIRLGLLSKLEEYILFEMDVAIGYQTHTIESFGRPQNVIRQQDGFIYEDELFKKGTAYDFAIRLAFLIK
ncbi:MAG: hypothetical protein ACJAS3_003395 [Roseivirga sp.]|jgi:hypothetical protein